MTSQPKPDPPVLSPGTTIGFVGLGNMGHVLCENLVAAGHPVVAFDIAGTEVRGVEPDEERLTREDEITSTVHYLKFTLAPAQQAAFAAGPVRIIVDHPAYQAEAVLTDEQRAALAVDFED